MRRYNKAIQEFKDRLKSNGVESRKIRGACMRKILVILNSMLKITPLGMKIFVDFNTVATPVLIKFLLNNFN